MNTAINPLAHYLVAAQAIVMDAFAPDGASAVTAISQLRDLLCSAQANADLAVAEGCELLRGAEPKIETPAEAPTRQEARRELGFDLVEAERNESSRGAR